MAKFTPEVLSPAGSYESLVAAVRSGADAVYLGAKEFSARRNAENFDDEALLLAVTYCHERGVKVYLTLNTVVRQKEMVTALNTARNAYLAGIDGIIVQDLGVARLINKHLPNLELHASTQMSLHSPAALKDLKNLGFSRVVVAREMSAAALKDFCQEAAKLGLEVEVFVHGALCMSVSGQCLLSAVLGARSGNRGLCAGPCRLPFAAENGTGYDLSLKDLSLLEHIEELKEMGVASLKIEGRMKRPEYVAAATAACRAAVDSAEIPADLSAALKGVFSRSGFTDGYFKNRLGRDMFGTRTKDDVLEAKDTFASLHELYRAERQSVEIKFEGSFKKDAPMKLCAICGEYRAEATGEVPLEAQNRATSAEDIAASLGKLGSTPYFCNQMDIDADDGIFIRNSALNALRRDVLEKLSALRLGATRSAEEIKIESFPQTKPKGEPKIIARLADINLLDNANGADLVVYPIEQEIPEGADCSRLVAEMPRWIENEESVKKLMEKAKTSGVKTLLCGNLSAVALAKELGFEIMGDTGLNLYNPHAVKTAAELGVSSAILSAETTAAEARGIYSEIPIGIFAYGYLPLMLLKNCPLKNGRSCASCDKKGALTDRMGIKFPVRCRLGYAQLLNSAPVYLADRLDEIKGADFLYLYFTDETGEDISRIIGEYRRGGTAPKDFTRGLTFRPSL